jgi:flagellar M-ring protein FliF
MEQLVDQLKTLPQKWNALGRGTRLMLLGAVVLLAGIGAIAWLVSGGADSYQYAFTNLSPEDGQAASAVLKTSGIPFRMEAGGSALAVPANKVYDARLLLAAQGLPKAGGVGFELFDKGQFGVSEFTQRVNLRRAIEGELSRTVGNLSEVRSARVHLSLGERGLYRDEDKKATASVIVALQPGRSLSDAQLSGIRHLVASAVPGLSPDAVTIVDGHGAVLGEGGGSNGASGFEAQVEAQLQQRIVSLLEPVVGTGAVLARITASADLSEVSQNSEVFDPDQTALRSEKKGASNQSSDQGGNGGIAGAQANQPLVMQQPSGGSTSKSQANSQDEQRTYEVSKTQTMTVIKTPRLRRLSVAVLLDAPKGVMRDEAELGRLSELVKKAIGFDEQRGDQLQLSQASFTRAETGDAALVAVDGPKLPWWAPYAAGAAGFLILIGVVAFSLRKKKVKGPTLVLKPGMKVAELEAQVAGAVVDGTVKSTEPAKLELPKPAIAALPSPELAARTKAAELVKKDPVKTAQLIRAWIAADAEAAKEARRG